MSTSNTRNESDDLIIHTLRRLATRTVLFHQVAAQSLGLFPTDLKSADLLNELGPMTAGELSEKTGLSTGSVTALIDRLEKAGYAKREKDPQDGRRVIIVPLTNGKTQVKQLFQSLSASTITLSKKYDKEELERTIDFISKTADLMDQELKALKSNM
ncbi:MarR family winged helix-turn-helix transcriptional regulator [Bacillus sp. NPDC077027]|uniref:MarR family winged helix-turn-helix transcriptional regulator n=1 Tax=Bacillus sp. NPDC077027 TaxID=3390548 RepID=UPI003D00F2A7